MKMGDVDKGGFESAGICNVFEAEHQTEIKTIFAKVRTNFSRLHERVTTHEADGKATMQTLAPYGVNSGFLRADQATLSPTEFIISQLDLKGVKCIIRAEIPEWAMKKKPVPRKPNGGAGRGGGRGRGRSRGSGRTKDSTSPRGTPAGTAQILSRADLSTDALLSLLSKRIMVEASESGQQYNPTPLAKSLIRLAGQLATPSVLEMWTGQLMEDNPVTNPAPLVEVFSTTISRLPGAVEHMKRNLDALSNDGASSAKKQKIGANATSASNV
jgi:hypothetical protein